VVISGDEGELSVVLGRALDRALLEVGLNNIRPHTVYRAAAETIHLWMSDYPATYEQLSTLLEAQGKTREKLINALENYQAWAYQLFLDIYPKLAAGANFDRHNGQSITDIYRQTVIELAPYNYGGIVVLWDEFGRFIETRSGEPTSTDVALLQEFSEACNQSNIHQIHLVLIAHNELGQYASHLPESYQHEWERIAGRFRQVDISGDPEVSYRLITEALGVADPILWGNFIEKQRDVFRRLLEQIFDLGLFRLLTQERIRELVIEGSYPLHPLATYCLPRLSARVAQNERTLFTFLASEEPNALGYHMARVSPDSPDALVRLDRLWDYFAQNIRADIGISGTHHIWANVETALHRIPQDDDLAKRLIKSIGVLSTIGEYGELPATTNLLYFAVGANDNASRKAVEDRLSLLVRRKTIMFNQIEDSWELFSGSGVDLETKLIDARESRSFNPIQRRQLLEKILPLRHYRARRFNQVHGMTRFFWSLYRTPEELPRIDWGLILRELRVDNGHHWEYADGLIIYVLTSNEAEIMQARLYAQMINHPQVLLVVPRRPLLIDQHLKEWLALDELNQDGRFKEQDPDRLQAELDFYLSVTTRQLERAIAPLVLPSAEGSEWYIRGEVVSPSPSNDSRVSRLLSDVCDQVFPSTPILYNELLNKREPSAVQVRAANKVIDAIISNNVAENLELSGHGPDVMAIRTILRMPGILRQTDTGDWEFGRPLDNHLAQIWDEIDYFLNQSRSEEQSFSDILRLLQSPPYGLRLGILPILIAAVMRKYLEVITVQKGKKVIASLTGETITDLCRNPEQYKVKLVTLDEHRSAMKQVLEKLFAESVTEDERRSQPSSYLSLGMLRWLQSQPRFARDTKHVSPNAAKLRNLIRQARTEPAKVLYDDLPTLLEDGITIDENSDLHSIFEQRLVNLQEEIASAVQELQRRLYQFAVNNFAADAPMPLHSSHAALNYWLTDVEQKAGVKMGTLRLGNVRAEGLVRIIQQENDNEMFFWDQLSQSLMGISLRDWNDQGEENFKSLLLDAQKTVECEAFGLAKESEAIQLHISAPGTDEQVYLFRPADLSPQGQRILQNFVSTLKIAGRPLTSDEQRQIVLALLDYVLGETDD